nr:tyrosine-protein phosphatase [uncultured Hyphomonas sp.]
MVRPDAGIYDITWTTSAAAAPVDIFVTSDPSGDVGEARQIADDDTDGKFELSAPESKERLYFLLVPENGEAVRIASRLLPLEGGRNFRDLGGYETTNGQHVKWGRVFRSGTMTRLTDKDYKYLSSLGIATIVDFRTSEERASEPTNWRAGDISYETFPDPAEDDANPLAAVFASPDVKPEDVRAMMAQLYSGILEQQTPAYRVLFRDLADDNAPLAFNCSAGKDRTGVGAALILSVLGVPRETVVADYALSEKLVDYSAEFQLGADDEASQDNGPYAYLRRLPPELVAPLMRSDPAYIEAVLDRIDQDYGSVEAFVREELDVSDADLARIRRKLLED